MTITDLFSSDPPDEDEAFTRAKRALLEAVHELDEFALRRRQGQLTASKARVRIEIVVDDVDTACDVLISAIEGDGDDGPDSGTSAKVAC